MTVVRLPTTPVPPPTQEVSALSGPVAELAGVLVARDDHEVAERIGALRAVCDGVVVVDDGSTDDTPERAEAAGARVLRLPVPHGEGAALRAGLRIARELGYIGGLVPGAVTPSRADLEALALAHVRAPEVLVMGVGPGEALAGKEWEAAWAEMRGEEPPPYPEWRPPASSGWVHRCEQAFESFVETRYSYPWGGPRVLPLQAVLRRDLRQDGPGVHLEILALAVRAGIPTYELELSVSPPRPAGDEASGRLLWLRLARLIAGRTVKGWLGMGSRGYGPPTHSPLLLAVGLGLMTALGCGPRRVATELTACEQELPRVEWPGDGDPQVALAELLASREPTERILVDQGVEVRDPGMDAARRLDGILALDDGERLRVRLMAMGMTVLDYIEAGDSWQLTVPPAGVMKDGKAGEPVFDEAELAQLQGPPLRPDLLAALVRSVQPGAQVRWQAGACAVLEEVEGGDVVRRIGFAPEEQRWLVAREAVLEGDVERLVVRYSDYRPAGAGSWPHRAEVLDRVRGSEVVLVTRRFRVDGVRDEHFAFAPR